MVMVVVGLKPHRINLWTSSQRPHESVMYYQLMNGCPAIIVPVRLGGAAGRLGRIDVGAAVEVCATG